MTRVRNTPVTRKRRKKIRKLSKSSFGPNTSKITKERMMRALRNAFIGRKQRKRFFRSKIWITRLNIGLRNEWKEQGLNYSQFIHLKKLAQIELDRKQTSEMTINQSQDFTALIDKIKNPYSNK